jgi:quinol monooxygenase YgiN
MVVVARLKAQAGKAEEVAAVLKELVPKVKNEEGTLAYTLNRSQQDPSVFLFYEKYTGAEALVAHSSTDYFKQAFKALAPLLAGPATIEMYDEVDAI